MSNQSITKITFAGVTDELHLELIYMHSNETN